MENLTHTSNPIQKTPRTEAQIAASRANGAKSKGPVTPEGKSISSRNAERHGFFSQLATIKGESPQEYVQVSTDLYETWQPTDEYERCLVDTMATCMWRRMRMLVLESVTLDTQLTAFGCTATADLNQTAHAFSTLSQKDGAFELIHRYESRYIRALERAGRNLMAYRKFRLQEASAQQQASQIPAEPSFMEEQPAEPPSPTPAPEPETKKDRNEPKPGPTGREARRLRRWQKRHPAPASTTNPSEVRRETTNPHPQTPSHIGE